FKSPMWITPLPPSLTALGEGSHGSILNGNYAPNRLSSAWKPTPHRNRIKIYRVPVGSTLDRVAHLAATVAPVGNSFVYPDGDTTIVNKLVDGTFDVPASWTVNGLWSVSGAVAAKTVGVPAAQVYQAWAASPAAADVLRIGVPVEATNGSNTFSFVHRSTIGSGGQTVAVPSGTGLKTMSMTITGAQTYGGFTASTERSVTISAAYAYVQTPACAPQGAFNYYAEAVNVSGIAGPLTSAVAATII
ncbi:hypothetical protein QBK99_12675, partial [Corticibacterium sp. UT-5YL-CI-8]|nr:hypothetical protein [Tianweitania sp. UT-5YL-CI-8]